ncbi:hypothetical protein FRC20_005969 [Serendipita sp. 405]|nr:hypothetical protein FRC20_005969 [Serendipita sp. 405]
MSDTQNQAEICTDCDPQVGSEPVIRQEDPLDKSTFDVPTGGRYPMLVIEYCDRCRWLHRATWMLTELSLTFTPPLIRSTMLVPVAAPEPAGRFRIWLITKPQESKEQGDGTLVWDRKIEDGFPDPKVVKQRIRDHVAPGMSLGHSDRK